MNHKLPSGPLIISSAPDDGVGISNSEIVPSVVMRPIRFPRNSVNHKLPSGPAVIPEG